MTWTIQALTALVLAVGFVLTVRATALAPSIRIAMSAVFGTLLAQEVIDLLELQGIAWADPIGDTVAGAVPFLWGGLLLLMTDRFHLRRLSAQRAQTDSLIDDVPAAVAVLDAEARIVRASVVWRQLFPSTTLGESLEAALGAMPENLSAALERARTEGIRTGGETERVPGEDRWWSWVVAPWSEESSGALVMIDDVTERVRRESDREATQRLVVLGELAAGVAHDMNNLLTILQLNLATFRGAELGDPPDATREAIASMEEAVRLAAEMTRGVLRLASSGDSADRARVALAQVVEDTVQLVRTTLLRRYELVLRSSADSATLEGNAMRLQQMLLNLIVNARDAMPEGGRIEVSLTEEAGEATIRVSDHGVGITPADQERIFTPFFTTKGTRGTGLGLCVVRGVVEEHGGRVEVESAPSRGTTFSVTLPVRSAHPSIARTARAS